jgi:hypothetical protein
VQREAAASHRAIVRTDSDEEGCRNAVWSVPNQKQVMRSPAAWSAAWSKLFVTGGCAFGLDASITSPRLSRTGVLVVDKERGAVTTFQGRQMHGLWRRRSGLHVITAPPVVKILKRSGTQPLPTQPDGSRPYLRGNSIFQGILCTRKPVLLWLMAHV